MELKKYLHRPKWGSIFKKSFFIILFLSLMNPAGAQAKHRYGLITKGGFSIGNFAGPVASNLINSSESVNSANLEVNISSRPAWNFGAFYGYQFFSVLSLQSQLLISSQRVTFVNEAKKDEEHVTLNFAPFSFMPEAILHVSGIFQLSLGLKISYLMKTGYSVKSEKFNVIFPADIKKDADELTKIHGFPSVNFGAILGAGFCFPYGIGLGIELEANSLLTALLSALRDKEKTIGYTPEILKLSQLLATPILQFSLSWNVAELF